MTPSDIAALDDLLVPLLVERRDAGGPFDEVAYLLGQARIQLLAAKGAAELGDSWLMATCDRCGDMHPALAAMHKRKHPGHILNLHSLDTRPEVPA